jgi:hypothetical protein
MSLSDLQSMPWWRWLAQLIIMWLWGSGLTIAKVSWKSAGPIVVRHFLFVLYRRVGNANGDVWQQGGKRVVQQVAKSSV